MLGPRYNPNDLDSMLKVLKPYGAEWCLAGAYFATSAYEFGMLLHRALMEDVHSELTDHHINRALYRYKSFTCLIYRDVIWTDHAGLFIGDKQMFKPDDCHRKYFDVIGQLALHFETLDATEVAGVGIHELLRAILFMVESEASLGNIQKGEAVSKALTKALSNIEEFNVTIEMQRRNVTVMPKG